MAGTQVFRVFGCAVSVLRGNAAAVCGERHLKICKTWLRLNGFDDTVEIDWDEITMQDEVDHANAAYLMAKTNQLLKEGEA